MSVSRTCHSRQSNPGGLAPLTAWLTSVAVALCATVGIAQSHSGESQGSHREARRVLSQDSSGPSPAAARDAAQRLPSLAYARMSGAIGADDGTYHAVAHSRGVRMDNDEQALAADFTATGVEFRLGRNRWRLALRGYGHGGALRDTPAVAPVSTANRVEYRRGPLTEWYVNGPVGVEQGFTIARAPEPSNGQPLTVTLDVGGDLTMSVTPDGRALMLRKDGAAAFRYAGLTAWDADGRELRTWLENTGTQLHLRVDDAAARYPVTIDPIVQAAKLVAQTTLYGNPHNDGVAGDQLGRSIAISRDGTTVVVGAPFKRLNNVRAGVAYVFVRPAEQAGGWDSVSPLSYANRLQASDFATSGLLFGMSVAVSADGGVIVVGATGPNSTSYEGAAYVYLRAAGYWGGGWALAQNARLTPRWFEGYSNFGGFGTAVSIADNGATIVVGSPFHSSNSGSHPDGAAYAFFRPAVGWMDATESYKISGLGATSNLINTQFGRSVSLSGNRNFIVVGAPAEWDYRGAVYVFAIDGYSNGYLFYRKITRFSKTDGGPYEAFGTSVSMNSTGSSFAVSAPGAPVNGRTQGVVQVYEQPSGLYEWFLKARLTMADGVEEDALGASLSISGDGRTIVAGSPHTSGTSSGAAYVFVKPVGGWINSTENAKVQPSDIMTGDVFGHAVAVSADGTTWVGSAPFATIGANARQGAANVFTGAADTPVAAVSPSSLMFGPVQDGLNPGPQMVTLTNVGAGPLTVTAVNVTGPFASSQNCLAASPLAPGSSCQEEVAFAPVSTALMTGTLTFTNDSAGIGGSTQQVSLQGYGIKLATATALTAVSANPAVVGRPVSVSFTVTPPAGAQTIPSGPVTVQANTGESCTGSAPSGSCAITFATAANRTLTASYGGDNTFESSTTPSLSLSVVDFSLSASPASQTATGKKASYTLTVTGVNGFAGTVALACGGGPANTTCAVSPTSVTLAGTSMSAKVNVTLPNAAPAGTYLITVTGSFGGTTRSTTAALIVK
jgi:hypothetical protein